MAAARRVRTSLMAERLLRKRLGLAASAKLIWQLKRRERRGEPWTDWPPPESRDEQACRQEAGQVVLLYEMLTEQIGREDALALLASIVTEAGVMKLRDAVPRLERKRFEALAEDEQERFLRRIMDQFPNATVGELELTAESFRYEITRCRFVELMHRSGCPELAPLFCSGDGIYFERHLPEVHFERPQTLAEGATCCDFRFRWK